MTTKHKKKKLSIKDILKGKFLVDESSFSNWRFVLFLAALALISISSSHWADKKVIHIRELQRNVAELKSQYAHLHKDVMSGQMESKITELAIKDSLKKAEQPPFKLVKVVQ